MPIQYSTSAFTVGDLLSANKVYCLPEFQRPYSWGEDRACQLFDDLQNACITVLNGNAPRHGIEYFLGAVIVAQPNALAPFLIIDGQQRLVTLTAILAVIRDHLPPGRFRENLQDQIERPANAAAAYNRAPRIQLRDIDQDVFKRLVIADGGTAHLPNATDTRSMANLLDVLHALNKDFPRANNTFIQNLATFILNNCGVVLISAHTIEDAYRLFKSVNNPGEPLSALALARTELLGPQVHNPRLCAQIAQAWDEIEDQLGEDELESYVRTVAALVIPGMESRDLFDVVRDISRDAQLSDSFNHKLRRFILSYQALETASIDFGEDSDRINRHISCIQKMDLEQWKSCALNWMSKNHGSHESYQFFKALDGLCLGLVVLGYKTKLLNSRFAAINTAIASGNVLARIASPLYLTDDERRAVRERISNPVRRNSPFLKPLLLRLNVAAGATSIPPYFPSDVQIEHILPQNPSANGEWCRVFSANDRAELTHLIGNMTLLTAKKNNSISNSDFLSKKSKIFSLQENNCFAITVNIANMPDWTPNCIRDRQNDLLRHAADIMAL